MRFGMTSKEGKCENKSKSNYKAEADSSAALRNDKIKGLRNAKVAAKELQSKMRRYQPVERSSHVGFVCSMRAIFLARFQSFSSVSRAIALRT